MTDRPSHESFKPDSFAYVIRAFLASDKFARLAKSTKDSYLRSLNIAARPEVLGAFPAVEMKPSIVQGHLDAYAGRPGAQMNARVALGAVDKWASKRDLLPRSIVYGTDCIGSDGGYSPWTDPQIETVLANVKPELVRVVMLASATGQRGSDLIKMRWNDIERDGGRDGINVIQKKTGLELWIPFTAALSDALATWDRAPGPILRRDDGRPWPCRNTLSVAWHRERDTNPALVECRSLVLHGLRATACVRLRRLGATESQISDMVGLSIPMVARYCRKSAQRDNAMAAVHYLDGTARERAKAKSKSVTD